ncbi:MAG: hypothetical protein ACPG7W_01205 [Paracoccaceae bacterium]
MAKLIATLNVIAWSGFWAFGYLAVMGDNPFVALVLAALGGGVGLVCWLWLARHAEAIGYARPANRAVLTEEIA